LTVLLSLISSPDLKRGLSLTTRSSWSLFAPSLLRSGEINHHFHQHKIVHSRQSGRRQLLWRNVREFWPCRNLYSVVLSMGLFKYHMALFCLISTLLPHVTHC